MTEKEPKNENNSQINKAFDAFSDNISKHLNPEYSNDPITQEKKQRLDKAFDSFREIKPSEIMNISDLDMINIIRSAFYPFSSVDSVDKALKIIETQAYSKLGGNIQEGDIERINKDRWIIKTEDALQKIQIALRDEYRTLKRKGE